MSAHHNCACVRGTRTHAHARTHETSQKHALPTLMMSDSPASLLLLPSLRVFPHSAGRSWVFLQADRTAAVSCRCDRNISYNNRKDTSSLAETLSSWSKKGGESQDGSERERMRKSLQPEREQPPPLSLCN